MYVCVDFDGTIVDHRFPKIGAPAPEALSWLREWQAAGAKIILWTMRSGETLHQAVEYLKGEGIELFGVNRNPDQSSWSQSPKAYAPVYVDDAAFGCPLIDVDEFARPCVDWYRVGPAVLHMIQKAQAKRG